jgi:WD40 repeat protein
MASIGPQRKGCVWNVDVALTNHVDPLSPIHYFGDGRKFPQAITFLNKGKEIAVSDNDGTVAIYSTKSGKKLNEYKGHKLAVNATAFARDRDLFVTGSSDWTVKVWNRSRVTELTSLQSHGASVTTVAITNDGTQAASGGTDGQVIIWELKNFK